MIKQNNIFSFFTYKDDKLDFYSDRSYYITNKSILWIKKEFPDIYKIGIDFFTLYESGNVLNLSTRPPDSIIDANKALIRIETSKPGCCGGMTVKTLSIPWKAKIIEVNHFVKRNLSLLTVDPFNKGWIYKMEVIITQNEISDKNNELNEVFVPKTNPDLMKKEIRKFLRKNKVISFGNF